MGTGKGRSPGTAKHRLQQMRFCASCGETFIPRTKRQDLCFYCFEREKRSGNKKRQSQAK